MCALHVCECTGLHTHARAHRPEQKVWHIGIGPLTVHTLRISLSSPPRPGYKHTQQGPAFFYMDAVDFNTGRSSCLQNRCSQPLNHLAAIFYPLLILPRSPDLRWVCVPLVIHSCDETFCLLCLLSGPYLDLTSYHDHQKLSVKERKYLVWE